MRKLQVGRAAIDWGKACSGFGVDMKGRGVSGRREGKGEASFNWDPQCKCPAREGGARRAFGAPRG